LFRSQARGRLIGYAQFRMTLPDWPDSMAANPFS
jgi:hypothetical protein